MQKQFQIAINKNIVPDSIRSRLNNSGLRMHHKYYRGASSSHNHNISENLTMFQYPEPAKFAIALPDSALCIYPRKYYNSEKEVSNSNTYIEIGSCCLFHKTDANPLNHLENHKQNKNEKSNFK